MVSFPWFLRCQAEHQNYQGAPQQRFFNHVQNPNCPKSSGCFGGAGISFSAVCFILSLPVYPKYQIGLSETSENNGIYIFTYSLIYLPVFLAPPPPNPPLPQMVTLSQGSTVRQYKPPAPLWDGWQVGWGGPWFPPPDPLWKWELGFMFCHRPKYKPPRENGCGPPKLGGGKKSAVCVFFFSDLSKRVY